eukprot:scaffold18474_cov107-Isochrysis_galbana.AAC.5
MLRSIGHAQELPTGCPAAAVPRRAGMSRCAPGSTRPAHRRARCRCRDCVVHSSGWIPFDWCPCWRTVSRRRSGACAARRRRQFETRGTGRWAATSAARSCPAAADPRGRGWAAAAELVGAQARHAGKAKVAPLHGEGGEEVGHNDPDQAKEAIPQVDFDDVVVHVTKLVVAPEPGTRSRVAPVAVAVEPRPMAAVAAVRGNRLDAARGGVPHPFGEGDDQLVRCRDGHRLLRVPDSAQVIGGRAAIVPGARAGIRQLVLDLVVADPPEDEVAVRIAQLNITAWALPAGQATLGREPAGAMRVGPRGAGVDAHAPKRRLEVEKEQRRHEQQDECQKQHRQRQDCEWHCCNGREGARFLAGGRQSTLCMRSAPGAGHREVASRRGLDHRR